MSKRIENELFICEGLPDFKKFTPESIQNEFPKVIKQLDKDFNNIEIFFKQILQEGSFEWEKIMLPLNKIN